MRLVQVVDFFPLGSFLYFYSNEPYQKKEILVTVAEFTLLLASEVELQN